MRSEFNSLPVVRKALVVAGVCLLAAALMLLVPLLPAMTGGSLAAEGAEGLRMVGRVAVSGCVLAAIGFWQ